MLYLSVCCYVVYAEWGLLLKYTNRELFSAFGRHCGYWVNPPGTALEAGFYLAIVF